MNPFPKNDISNKFLKLEHVEWVSKSFIDIVQRTQKTHRPIGSKHLHGLQGVMPLLCRVFQPGRKWPTLLPEVEAFGPTN